MEGNALVEGVRDGQAAEGTSVGRVVGDTLVVGE